MIRSVRRREAPGSAGRRVLLAGILGFLFLGLPGGAVEIKLASSLPRNSDWANVLDRIAADWYRISNGEVTLNISHQRAGSEEDYLRWLRQNRFQAAVFTSSALNNAAPEIMALSIPFLIRNNEEFDAVLAELRPLLDAKIEEQNLKALAWVKGGWVKIFSRSRVSVPDDLRRLRLATSPSDKKFSDAFKAMGFQLVGATMNDIPVFFNAGRIDAIYQSPIAVQATSLYRVANHLLSLNLAPFMGGILMSRQGWASIPERYREPLREVVRQAGMEFEESFYRQEAEAVAIMRREGLVYNEISSREEQIWFNDISGRIPGLVDRNVFDKAMYLRIQDILERYRSSH
jgi:TRAP-type C4-dicarboxylate transport system substrate-binding protein